MDIWFLDEEAGVRAFVLGKTLKYCPELIGKATCQNVSIFGDLDELAILKCVACIFVNDGADEAAWVCAEVVCLDRKCLSDLQEATMKFVGFDDKGEIGNVVILDYHIDEMGFHLSA